MCRWVTNEGVYVIFTQEKKKSKFIDYQLFEFISMRDTWIVENMDKKIEISQKYQFRQVFLFIFVVIFTFKFESNIFSQKKN